MPDPPPSPLQGPTAELLAEALASAVHELATHVMQTRLDAVGVGDADDDEAPALTRALAELRLASRLAPRDGVDRVRPQPPSAVAADLRERLTSVGVVSRWRLANACDELPETARVTLNQAFDLAAPTPTGVNRGASVDVLVGVLSERAQLTIDLTVIGLGSGPDDTAPLLRRVRLSGGEGHVALVPGDTAGWRLTGWLPL